MPPNVFKGRKLLIASIGVAAVTYACNNEPGQPRPVGNLMPPTPYDAGTPTVDVKDAGSPNATNLGMTSGDVVAPPPLPADAGAARAKPR